MHKRRNLRREDYGLALYTTGLNLFGHCYELRWGSGLTVHSILSRLLLLLLDDHLPLGKIADHHSPFSQSVRDEMGGLMQTVLLFVALAFRDALVHLGEMDVPAGLLRCASSSRLPVPRELLLP
jgi:fumarate reductase subunit D